MKLMGKFFGLGSLLLLLLTFHSSTAQNLSNRGTEFWVGYGHHQFFETGANSQEMVLYLSAEQTANVTITINGTAYAQNYTIPANTVIATTPIPKSGVYDCRLFQTAPGFTGANSEGTSDRGIRILSDVPIVAYAHIYGSASSGATMLMPVETWGYSYVTVNSQQRYGSNNCFSWMYVVARENNTRVEITPSVDTRGGRAAGTPFQVTLNRGQVYQVLGALITASDGLELTGTKIRSVANAAGQCYPIGVFAGSSRTYITCSGSGGSGGDNIIQQVFPFQAWGRKYLTAPTSNGSAASSLMTNIYRVAVKDPTTVVTLNGVQLTGLFNNTYYEYQSGTADYIEADKPIMVAQYMASNGSCANTSGNGDPEMMYISPIEQAIKRVGFYRNTRENIVTNYLTLIIPTNGIPSLTIDGVGSAGFSYSYAHPNRPGYTVVVKRFNAAQAQCVVQSDSAFTAVTYGLGSVESYGYNAGTLINNLNVIGNLQNTPDTTTATHAFTCKGTPVKLSMLVAYQPTSMTWKLSQVPSISPNADYTNTNPVPSATVVVNGVTYYRYELPGNYTFSDTGTIEIPVLNTHPSIDNCNNTELVKFSISVKVKPVADFSLAHTGCLLDSLQLTSPVTTSNNYAVNSWSWQFSDNTSATGQSVSKLFNTSGAQTINLKVVTAQGCLGDTTRNVTIFDKPYVNFTASQQNICAGSTVTFTDTSFYGGTAPINTWFWDLNGTSASLTSNAAQTMTFPNYGTYTIKHLVKVSNTCVSDTVTRVISVYANPVPSFTFPAGCLPSNGVVQFVNASTVADNHPITYSWNFGDANANASNPNTSNLTSPTHNYAVGTYTIRLNATTDNGCSRDTSVTTTFNIRGQLAYPALVSVCESVRGTVSVASALVTNSVPGTGIYRGPGTDTAGNFRPSVAGAGIHTIWYVFTSAGGCRDSISTQIKVHPKPIGNFTVNADICLNQPATIADASSLSSGAIIGWNWSFGDNTTANNTSNASFVKNYNAFGNYTIRLVAISDSSCVSDTISRTVAVHDLPRVDFTLPAYICMPNGSGNFTNNTTIGDGSALSYVWNFGDNSGTATTANPMHNFSSNGPFTIRLTATSAFGCVDDSTKVLSAFYDKPVANFTVAPDTLCQGTNNVFTNLSTAPNSTVQGFTWSFGDGTNSTTANPTKIYTRPGNYSVSLTVRNAVGCTSDPFTKNVIVYLQPVIDAGPSFIVPEGTIITFNPRANDSTVLQFYWTPTGGLSNASVLRPQIVALQNQTYRLTAIGQGNCSASDTLTVKILRPVQVPNAFSPNGDGINDTWLINNLVDYPGATVEIYNRYGQMVYQSNGYNQPWNGTHKGAPLPFATYYYIITLKNGFKPMTGSVTIVK